MPSHRIRVEIACSQGCNSIVVQFHRVGREDRDAYACRCQKETSIGAACRWFLRKLPICPAPALPLTVLRLAAIRAREYLIFKILSHVFPSLAVAPAPVNRRTPVVDPAQQPTTTALHAIPSEQRPFSNRVLSERKSKGRKEAERKLY